MKQYKETKPDEPREDKVLHRAFSGNIVKKIDSDKRQIEFIISTADVDRMGDIIDVNGWDLKSFKKNPVVLFGHNSSIPPVGKAIKVWKEADALMAIAEFMDRDISAFAHSIFRMYEEGFLRATSVGFKPKKWKWIEDEEGNETWGIHFEKQELLEFSCVPIPANPEALISARQKGIDTEPFKQFAEEVLDNWNKNCDEFKDLYHTDKQGFEQIRRRAAGSGSTYRVPPEVQDEIMKRNLETVRKHKQQKEALKKKDTKTVKLFDEDAELPVIDEGQVKQAGRVEVTKDTVNDVDVLNIDKAENTALFTKEFIHAEDDRITIEKREGDDGEVDFVLTIKGDNIAVEYDLIGLDANDDFFGVKMSETPVEDEKSESDDEEDEDDAKAADDEPEAKSDDEADDEEEDEGKSSDEEDEEDEDEKSDDSDDEEDDEKAADDVEEKAKEKADDDEEVELNLPEQLRLVENVLCELEERLDSELDSVKESRHTSRKARFLAGYMRELADRLDGGNDDEKTSAADTTKSSVTENEEEGMTEDEAEEYKAELMKSITPTLSKLIADRVRKARGRLD